LANFGSFAPVRAAVSPLPRQAATPLAANRRERGLEKNEEK